MRVCKIEIFWNIYKLKFYKANYISFDLFSFSKTVRKIQKRNKNHQSPKKLIRENQFLKGRKLS